MSDDKSMIDDLVRELKKQRDELSLQMHLGSAELKEQWGKLDERYQKLSDDYKPLRDAVGESTDNVFAALRLAAEELANGFDRIRKEL